MCAVIVEDDGYGLAVVGIENMHALFVPRPEVDAACQLQLYLAVAVSNIAGQSFGKIEVSVPAGHFQNNSVRLR